jgi:hypothetical protein
MAVQARPRSTEKSGVCRGRAAAAAPSPPASTLSFLALSGAALALLLCASTALAARTHGEVSRLDAPCVTKLDELWARHYPDVNSTTPGGNSLPSLCRSIVEQALAGKANDRCPDEKAVLECLNEAP